MNSYHHQFHKADAIQPDRKIASITIAIMLDLPEKSIYASVTMAKKFSLYVWNDDFALDYTPGMAVAVATSADEARQAVRDAMNYCPESDLEKEPKVFPLNNPIGFAVLGGG